MKQDKKYILAVPNFSEGRRNDVIEEIVGEVKNIEGVKLVSYEPEYDFNRTVVTLIGEIEPLKKALLKLACKSIELIDMRKQQGTHPRIGSQDTIPLFPFKNITVEECIDIAEDIAKELYAKTEVPIYFAAGNARTEDKKSLAFIRKGQYEGLRDLLKETKNDPNRKAEYESRKPDISNDGLINEKSGAVIVSAEAEGLTAYNIFLNTEDLSIAKKIAKGVRGPSGGFSTTRAVGIKFPERSGVVVSINMFDCKNTPIYRIFNFVKQEAARYGVIVTGSQIVGPIKLEYIVNSWEYQLQLEGFRTSQILETHLMDM